jgi:hypothetical protein
MEATKFRPLYLYHSIYLGPVSVRSSASWGRGLFTIETIKAGGLLLCEKAFAYTFVDTAEHSQDMELFINTETNSITTRTQAGLIRMIVQKLYRNPSLVLVLINPYHGSYKPVGVSDIDSIPVVDT